MESIRADRHTGSIQFEESARSKSHQIDTRGMLRTERASEVGDQFGCVTVLRVREFCVVFRMTPWAR